MTTSNPSIVELRGAMTALVTPFRDGRVDFPCLDRLVDRQIEAGMDWLVPCGTTGESPTLSADEADRILDAVLARAGGRCRVLMGTGSNDTKATVEKTLRAARAGADAVMLVAPYYNRPTQEGLFRHFSKVAGSVDLPVVLYNVPFRTGVEISNDVVVRLRESCRNIVAIKHATGNVDGVTDLLTRCDIIVLSGDDQLTWPLMSLGAAGVISVVSNIDPGLVRALVDAAQAGQLTEGLMWHRKVERLATALALHGPNPIPIKTAMAVAGLLKEEFRLPLCSPTADARDAIRTLLIGLELLEPTCGGIT